MDIALFRTNPDLVKESQRRRGAPVELVDKVIELDDKWRKRMISDARIDLLVRFEANQATKLFKDTSKQVGEIKKVCCEKVGLMSAERQNSGCI